LCGEAQATDDPRVMVLGIKLVVQKIKYTVSLFADGARSPLLQIQYYEKFSLRRKTIGRAYTLFHKWTDGSCRALI